MCDIFVVFSGLLGFAFVCGVAVGVSVHKFWMKLKLFQKKGDNPKEGIVKAAPTCPPKPSDLPPYVFLTCKGGHYHLSDQCSAVSGKESQMLPLCGHCSNKSKSKKDKKEA